VFIYASTFFSLLSRRVCDAFFAKEGKQTYITSAAYLEHIRSFTNLTNAKQEEIMRAKERYVGGLDKLLFAAEQVRQFLLAVTITENDHENLVGITDGMD
jgi:dynein heavy chain